MTLPQEQTRLDIVRPVKYRMGDDDDAPIIKPLEDFLTQAQTLANLVFAEDAEAFLSIQNPEITGSADTVYVGASKQRCRVFNPDGLRLPLLERITIPEARAGGSFLNAYRRLTHTPQPTKKQLQLYGGELPSEPQTLKDELKEIQEQHGFTDPDNLRIGIVKQVSYRYRADTDNALELTLKPNLGEKATFVLIEQSRYCVRRLGMTAIKVAMPNSYEQLDIPFARLRTENLGEGQMLRFLSDLANHIPRYLTLGEPSVRVQISH